MCISPIDLKNPGRKVPAKMEDLINERNSYITEQNSYRYKNSLIVPCGKCVECLKEYSEMWALRVTDEARKYSRNCVITLTYDELHNNGSVCKRDVQLFMKRLRKHLFGSEKGDLRYFACGEYGSKRQRPHYHIILFNFDFEDKYFWSKSKRDNIQYRSPTLEKLWKYGFSTIGDLDYDTAKYCAKYLQKLNKPTEYTFHVEKPFLLMSRKPGLGNPFADNVDIETDKVYLQDGKYKKLPRYYLEKYSLEEQNKIKCKRQKNIDLYVESFVSKKQYEEQYITDLEKKSVKYQNFIDKKTIQ